MILQYPKTLSMIYISIILANTLFHVSETSQVLSLVLFQQSLYFNSQNFLNRTIYIG